MIAFGTFKKKSAFKMYARAKKLDFDIANNISKQIEKYDEAMKYADDDEKDSINIYDFVDEEYHSYITDSKPYWGIVSDKKKAPCAHLLYGGSIREEIGLIKCKSDSTKKEYITAVIDGAIAEKYKFLKNDLLKVDVVLLINMIYNRIGIPVHSINELMQICENDDKTWDIYAKGLTLGVNQCEKPQAVNKLKKYKPRNISELAAFIAAIRPAFKSMYSKFESREHFEYGIPALDNLIQTPQFPHSFILYQETTMSVLNWAGFPMDECYGIIKSIAKKHPEKVKPLKERFISGFKDRLINEENQPASSAEETANAVWQIIDDSCGYGFNSAHAACMAYDSLYGAWLKANHPFEFYEVMLQFYSDKGNKDKVSALKQEMLDGFGINEGDYKFGNDNRKFVAVPDKGFIAPSLLSIKSMNQSSANKLFDLSKKWNPDNTNFYELFKIIKNKKIVDREKLNILINIGYFKDFGSIKKISRFIEYIDLLFERVQFSKSDVSDEIRPLIEKYSETTDKLKTYKNFDYDSALNDLWLQLENEKDSPVQIIINELKYIGYIKARLKCAESFYAVISIDGKFANKTAVLHQLSTGHKTTVKVKAKTLDERPLEIGTVIRVDEIKDERKYRKTQNGFEQINEYEPVLKKYVYVR